MTFLSKQMRRIAFGVSIAGIAAALGGGADDVEASAPKVVFDARIERETRPASAGDEARVARELGPIAYAAWPKDCASRDFTVVDSAAGAFTRRGADQRAVLYQVCTIGRQNGIAAIAVSEGARVVRHVSFEGRYASVGALPDLDGNGLDEIRLSALASGQGSFESWVTLLELAPGHVRDIASVSTYQDSCGTEHASVETASVVRAAGGPSFGVTKEDFARPCGSKAAWRSVSSPRPVKLAPAGIRWVQHL